MLIRAAVCPDVQRTRSGTTAGAGHQVPLQCLAAPCRPAYPQEGMVQFVNEPFLRLFGYRKGELEGRWASVCWVVRHDCMRP